MFEKRNLLRLTAVCIGIEVIGRTTGIFDQALILRAENQPTLAWLNFLWAIGMLIVSFAIQMLITPKADKPAKATLADFDYPQFEEGTPQAIYFGDNWSPDFFVAWYGNLRTSAIKSSGGKK